MPMFLVAKILAISLFINGGFAFLLDGSTVRPNGGSQYLTTRHYVQLMDSLYEEKQARHQLEQIVATLQTKMDAINNNCGQPVVNITTYIQPYIASVENQEREIKAVRINYDSLLQIKEAEIAKLSTTMTALEQNYISLLHDSTVTQTDYQRLKLEVESLKQIKNLDVANGLQETKNDINMLKASNQARSQDFLALFNLTISAKKDIRMTTKKLDNINNGSATKIQDLNDKISWLEMSHNLTSLQVNTNVKKDSEIDTVIRGLNDKLTQLENSQKLIGLQINTTVRSLSTKVGFTVKGGTLISGDLIEFPTLESSYGLSIHSVYTGGIYHVTIPGYYLITINILATKDAYFYIRKNRAEVAAAMVHYGGSNNGYHMASVSAFVQLSSGDTVTIKGSRVDAVGTMSSMTIVRI